MAPPYRLEPDFDCFVDAADLSLGAPTPKDEDRVPSEYINQTPPLSPLSPSDQLRSSPVDSASDVSMTTDSSYPSSYGAASTTEESPRSLSEPAVNWPYVPVPAISYGVPIHFSEIGAKGKGKEELPDPNSKPYRGLSTELRLMIWRNFLVAGEAVNVNGKSWRSAAELTAVFSLCKEVYREATDVFFHDNCFRIDNRHAISKFMHCISGRAKKTIRRTEMVLGDTSPSQAGRSYTIAKMRDRGTVDAFIRHIRPLTNLISCTITWPDSDNWFWDKDFVFKGYLGIFSLFIELRQLPERCSVGVPKASEEVQRTFRTIQRWPKGIPATTGDLDHLFRALQPSSHPPGADPSPGHIDAAADMW